MAEICRDKLGHGHNTVTAARNVSCYTSTCQIQHRPVPVCLPYITRRYEQFDDVVDDDAFSAVYELIRQTFIHQLNATVAAQRPADLSHKPGNFGHQRYISWPVR